MDNTSTHAKFYVISFSTFRDMASLSYPSPEGNESSRFDIYPLESTKIRKKITFIPQNIFF